MQQSHGDAEQIAPHVSKIKIAAKRSRSGAAGEESSQGPTTSAGAGSSDAKQPRAKRDRQTKASKNEDYDYNGGAFGAEDGFGDPDMLEDNDDDYDVLGKPRRAKGKKQGGGGQVRFRSL